MSRILVVSSDVIGERMAGPGIRAWEFGRSLMGRHQVTLAAPGPVPPTAPFKVIEAMSSAFRSTVTDFDVAIVQGYALHQFPVLEKANRLVIDLYDPFVLENLEVHAEQALETRQLFHEADLSVLRRQLIRGDYFICASERQRHFWLGMLTAVNRVNPFTYDADRSLRRLIDVVPFGLPAGPLIRSGPGLRDGTQITESDVVLIWGGGIWNWFDPLTLIRAMATAVDSNPGVKLVFMGTRHPNPGIPQMKMLTRAYALSKELGLTDRHVFFRPGWVPYEERQNLLADADIGVSINVEHVEAIYSFRTRVLDYLWAGLPVILTRGDEMGDLAEDEEIGIVVDYEDVDGLARAILRLAEDRQLRSACRARTIEVARRFEWSSVIAPLDRYCQGLWAFDDAAVQRRELEMDRRLRGSRPSVLLRKAVRSLMREGPRSLARRTYKYARRRL